MNELKYFIQTNKEFISQKFQLFNDNNIQKIDRSSIPVLPNFFINLNIADSLNEMNKVNFSNGKNDCGQQFIKTNKDIPNDEKYLLNTLKGIQDLQSTPYIPISIISNSRTKHEVIIQNILSSQREITTNFFDESNGKIYEGDIIGYLERRRLNSIDQKILILTTPGLDATPSLEKTKEEMRSFQNLKMYIKNYQNIEGDDKGYSKQLTQGPSEQEEKTQLFTIFQLMKKSIVCYYLIHQSNTIYVVLQDNEQDFALYKQIELICSNFLVSEGAKKEINFIHYYPSISDVKSKHAEIQFETIKSKYNLKDTASDFKNECFMKFEQQEDRGSSNYRKKMNKQIQFQHIMLFGDFESRYNQQLFEQIRKDIDNTRCDKIVPNQIETNFRIHIFQYLAYFFQTCDEKQQSEQNQFFQFKERQINEVEDNFPMDDTFQEWKDLIFYPYSFLTPNSIKQHKLF